MHLFATFVVTFLMAVHSYDVLVNCFNCIHCSRVSLKKILRETTKMFSQDK